jgi:hypothetical protein
MPKVELGTFGVVAGEELNTENKNLPVVGGVGGAFCVFGVLCPITFLREAPPAAWRLPS